MVRARANRADDLFGLGGRKDELDVLRRFFDELEQSVEALRRNHVRLIEDEDFVAVASGRVDCALTQIAGIVDTVVAGGVNLYDVEASSAVARKLHTTRTHTTGSICRTLGTVQAASQDARARGLATTSRATEEVGVVDAVRAQGRHEWLGHLRLPDHLGKSFWPITAIQCGSHASIVLARGDSHGTKKGPLAHPPEPGYPCFVSVLGELAWMAPREEPISV